MSECAKDTLPRFLDELKADGLELWLEANELRFRAPAGRMTSERLARLRARKNEIVSFLAEQAQRASEPVLTARGSTGVHPVTVPQAAFVRQYPALESVRSHHVAFCLRIAAHVEVSRVQEAVAQLLQRHSILRARYEMADGALCVRIDPSLQTPIDFVDIEALDPVRQEALLPELLSPVLLTRFDLNNGPLVRVAVIRRNPVDHLIAFVAHHSVTDAWSSRIMTAEFMEVYRAMCAGRAERLPELPVQFTDYAYWQKLWLESPAGRQQLIYWKRVLAGASEPFWLPPDHGVSETEAAPIISWVDCETRQRLEQYARDKHSTLFVVVLAALAKMLAQWSRREDVMIAVAHSGRWRPEVHALVGCFIQRSLLRVDLSGCADMEQVFARVRDAYQEAVPYLQLPYGILRPELVDRCSSGPLLEITLNYIPDMRAVSAVRQQDIVVDNRFLSADDARMEQSAGGRLFAKFMEDEAGGLTWSLRFPKGMFADSTVRRASADLRQHFQVLASQVS